jgi:deoxyribodipyrimidine photo-lyase
VQPRVLDLNGRPVRPGGRYILYWMQTNRRVDSNHALAAAVDLANRLHLPVLCYDRLTCDSPYASGRLHTFVLEGVPETARRLERVGIGYIFHLPRQRGGEGVTAACSGALHRLAAGAAAVFTDDYPLAAHAGQNRAVAAGIDAAMYAVDSSCIVPMSQFAKREWAAYTLRPKLHRLLADYLRPVEQPPVLHRWQEAPSPLHTEVTDGNVAALVAACEIDHTVRPSTSFRGGRLAAERQLATFLEDGLRRYATGRNEPSAHATSNLSPYLHFGQISSLEVALAVTDYARLHHFTAHEFLEELIVRRELSFNFARYTPEGTSLDALPDWVRADLDAHRRDEREFVYTRDRFEQAATHDDLWNATQKELLLRGKIHGYYRMYWGKKAIEWSRSYEEALATMVYLHGRYALDGRDPNTYAGILWCFGLHDRPWIPRPVFGKIRFLSRGGMDRKTNVRAYIEEIANLERSGSDSAPVETLFR